MKQLLTFLLYGILSSSVQTQSQPQWLADFGSGFGIPVSILKLSGVKETDHVHNASHKTSQSTSSKFLGGTSVDPKQNGNTNKPDVQNLLANPSELPPPPLAARREQSPFDSIDSRPPPPATRKDQSPVESIDSRPPPVSATDPVRERKLQQLKFIMGNDVPIAKLEALLDVFGSDSTSSQSSQSQQTRPPPPRNAPVFPPRERQERPSSNGWPSTPPPPREARGPFRRQEPRVDPFLSGDSMPSAIPPPPGSANRGQRQSRFNREFTSPTPSPPSFDGPPQGRLDMDARRQEMIERRLQQEQAKNSQESNLQMMRTLRALTRQRARTPAAEAPEQPEPGSMNPLLMAALFSGMGGGGEAGSTGLGGGLGSLLGGGGDLASLMAMQRGGSASGTGETPIGGLGMGGLGGGLGGLLGGMGGGMGGLASMLGMGGLGGTSATDTTDQAHDHPVNPTTLPVQAITTKVSNGMAVAAKTGQISQTRLGKTTDAPKPILINVGDHHQPNQHVHSIQTHIDPVMFLDVNNQIHDHPVPHSNNLSPDVRSNLIEQPSSNKLLPSLLDSTMNKGNKKNITLQGQISTTMPSSVRVGVRRKGTRIPARQNLTGENTVTTPGLMPTKEMMNVSSNHHSGLFDMISKTPNAGFGVHLGSHLQSSFGSMQNNLKTTVSPPAPLNAAMDIHGQIHDHPVGPELTGNARGHSSHRDLTAGHGQQSGNGKLAGRDNQSSGNVNSNNPSSATGIPSDLAALFQMQMGARGSGVSNNDIGMGGLPLNGISMTGRGIGSSGTGGFGNMGAVTTSLEMMSLVPGLTLDHMSDLVGSYRGPIPREILLQAQALSRAGQSGDHIADVLGDVMQQWVRQQGLAANTGFSAGSAGVV